MRAYAWHEPFSTLMDEIRQAFPNTVAAVEIDPDGTGGAKVRFSGEAPQAAVEVLEEFPQPVTIRDDAGFTERQLTEDLTSAHMAVYEDERVTSAGSNLDIRDASVTVAIEFATDLTATQVELAAEELQDLAESTTEDARVSVTIVDAITIEEDAIIGGGHTTPCTAGFTVQSASTGAEGVLSAAHCGSISYTHEGVSYALTQQDEHYGSLGDIQWLTPDDAGVSVMPQFTPNPPTIRNTVGSGMPEVGQRLYQYGKTEGPTDDDVVQINSCRGSICGLTAMSTRQRDGGDSGGPVFAGNRAYGIHSGNTTVDGSSSHDGFTRIWSAEDVFDVLVLVP